jgi:hypothetical protein
VHDLAAAVPAQDRLRLVSVPYQLAHQPPMIAVARLR